MKNQRKPKGNYRKSVQNVRKVGFFLEKTKKIDQKKKKAQKKKKKKTQKKTPPGGNSLLSSFLTCTPSNEWGQQGWAFSPKYSCTYNRTTASAEMREAAKT